MINLKAIRKDNYYENSIRNFISNCKYELTLLDQDILNKVFSENNKIKCLSKNNEFNRYVDTITLSEIKKIGISLLHYEGPHNKPWKGCACRHYYIWWKYAWSIKDYRKKYFNILPCHAVQIFKKIIGFIKIKLGLKVVKKYDF